MTNAELKQYLSDNRNDGDAFIRALSELINRHSDTNRYPADIPLEKIERVIRGKIENKNS